MTGVIIPLFYLPPIQIFAHLSQTDSVWLEACENYQKGSFRNKAFISTSQGPHQLSIPLSKGKHQQQSIKETKISYRDNWVINHLRSIQTAYGNSPFFEHYYQQFEAILASRTPYLYDFNFKLFDLAMSYLSIDVSVKETSSFVDNYNGNFVDLRSLNRERKKLPKYPQVHEANTGFQSDLCILDLIFNLGPESRRYLQQINLEI